MNNVYIFSIQTLQLFRNQYLYTMYILFRFWVYVSHKTFEQTYLHKWPNGIDIAGLQQLFDRMQYFKNPPEVHTPVCNNPSNAAAVGAEKKIFSQKKFFRQISSRLSFFIMYRKKPPAFRSLCTLLTKFQMESFTYISRAFRQFGNQNRHFEFKNSSVSLMSGCNVK